MIRAFFAYGTPFIYLSSNTSVNASVNMVPFLCTSSGRKSLNAYERAHDKKKKPTKWHVRPAKTQISLGTQSDKSLAVHSMGSYGPKLSSCGQQRL